MQSRKLNSSTMLNLWPKKPSLGDPETVTLAALLTSTAGDLGNPSGRVSRTNPCCPQHLPGQGSETGEELQLMPHGIQHTGQSRETDGRKLCFPAKVLKAQLKDQLHEAKSVVTGKNAVSPPPASRPRQRLPCGRTRGRRPRRRRERPPRAGSKSSKARVWPRQH